MNKVLFKIYYSKIANTGHHSCMFSVVYNNIQKIPNISIKKPIILISILNKYLDIPIYLDNCTPLIHMCTDYQGVHDYPVSLQIHAKAYFGTMTKCVDYAGVLIFTYPD